MKKKITSRKKNLKKQLAAGALAILLGMFPCSSDQSAHARDYRIGPGPVSTPDTDFFINLFDYSGGNPLIGPRRAPDQPGAMNVIKFVNTDAGMFGGDRTLTNAIDLDRYNYTIDGTSVNYNLNFHVASAGASNFINTAPDHNFGQMKLYLQQVIVAEFTTGSAVLTNNFSRPAYGYNIDMHSGQFARNLRGIDITHGVLRVDNYGVRQNALRPAFYDNYANGTFSIANGGAIYGNGARLEINDAIFGRDPRPAGWGGDRGNIAESFGGAIYITGNYGGGRHRISSSEFYANQGKIGGGAIYSNSNLDIFGSTFGSGNIHAPHAGRSGNTAGTGGNTTGYGGVIYYLGGGGATALNIGAVAQFDGNNQPILQRTFVGFNQADKNGGAIYFVGTHANSTSLNINDSIFNANYATGIQARDTSGYPAYGNDGGGVIYATNATTNIGTAGSTGVIPVRLTLDNDWTQTNPSADHQAGNVSMRDNEATRSGGAVNVAGTKLGMSSSVTSVLNIGVADGSIANYFGSNRAGTATVVGMGGAVYAVNTNVNIYANTKFSSAHTELDGDDLGNGNVARYGGAIAIHGLVSDADIRFETNIDGTTFLHNRASDVPQEREIDPSAYLGSGGAIWVEGSKLYLTNSTFGNMTNDLKQEFGNIAYEHGGAIFLSKVIMNTAVGDARPSNAREHEIINTVFERNIARSIVGTRGVGGHVSTSGGAVHISQVHANIKDQTRFTENMATMREYNPENAWKHGGGAIALTDIFDTNATEENYYFKAQLTVDDVTFERNVAGSGYTMTAGGYASPNSLDKGGGSGGAILVNNAHMMTVNEASFTGNAAWAYRDGADAPVGATTAGLRNDEGGYGGAMMIQRNLENDGSITAPDQPYYALANQQFVTDSTFIENVAENFGGAISIVTIALQDEGTHGTDRLEVILDGSGLATGTDMFARNKSLVGGAIYDRASTLTVQNARFSGNEAREIMATTVRPTQRTDGRGGAIAVEGAEVDNLVANDNFYHGILNLNDSVLVANTASMEGGGIYSMESLINVVGSTFGAAGDATQGNRAVRGGAISVHQSHLRTADANTDAFRQIIDQSHFYGNVATNSGATADATYNEIIRGGAINIEDTVVLLTNSGFTDNQVTTVTKSDKLTAWEDIGGGAIAVTNNLTGFRTGLDADTLVFTNNSAQGFGGAILSNDATVFNVKASTFDGNRASTFTPADNGTARGGDGGAMALYKNDAVTGVHWVYSSTFTNNAADRDGGAIVATGLPGDVLDLRIATTSPGPVVSSEFTGNNAIRHGGAVHATDVALNVTDANFQENTAGSSATGSVSQGGAIWIQGGSLNLGDAARDDGVTFTNNVASFQGGAIYVTGGCDTDIVKTQFTGNGFADGKDFTTKQGGAIFYNGPATNNNAYHRITLSSFDDNKVSSSASTQNLYGGAIAMTNGAKLQVEGSDFNRNLVAPSTNPTAVFGGGAIGLRGNGTEELVITSGNGGNKRSTFDANEADGHGGAIYVSNAALFTVNASDFTNNAATANIAVNGGHGGAIYVVDSPLSGTNVTDSTFDNNTAVKDGGAISTVNSGATSITGTTLTNNTATTGNGGALNVIGGTTVILTDSQFGTSGNGNMAGGKGGGVNATNLEGDFISDNTTYTGNTAQTGGGVNLDWTAATGAAHNVDITIPGGVGTDPVYAFDENSATSGDGGGLNIDLGRSATQNVVTTITDGSFRNNTASGNGGGIAIKNVSEQGATSVLNVNATNKNVMFTGNTADGKGNDIYLVKTDSFFNAAADRTITISGGLQTDSKVDKNGAGMLLIKADSFITYPGTGETDAALNVNEGTLSIGTYENADGEKVGAIVTVTGDTYMREGSTLSASLNDIYAVGVGDRAALYTEHFLLETGGGGAKPIITINDFTGGGSPPIENCGTYPGTGGAIYTIVEAKHDINKDDYNFVIAGGTGGTVTEKDFLWYQEVRTEDNRNKVQFGAGLVWDMQDPSNAHGTFFIDEGMVFTLNTTLKDNTIGGGNGNAFGWDGTTFTKTGKGLLVLGGVDNTEVGRNQYSGDTYVKEGTLAVTHSTNGIIDSFKADSVVRISGGATFQVGAYGIGCTSMGDKIINAELVNELVDNGGAGNFAVAAGPGGEVRINRENSYSGLTTIKSGTLKLGNILGMGVNDFDKIVQIDEGAELNLALGTDAELKKKLEGTGSLRKENSNTVTVTNDNRTNNPYTGTIYIDGGRLVADHQGNANKIVDALGTGNVVMSNNSYLELKEEGRYDSTITGLGHVDLTSGTETTLTSSASDYTGSTNVLNGTDLTITHVNATGRNASLTDNGGPVNLSAASNLIFDLGDGTHNYYKQIVAADGSGGYVVKKGDDKVVLHNGNNNYQGGTTIEGGELSITHVKAAGTGQVDVWEGADFAVDAAGTFENVVVGGGDVYYNPGSGRDLTVTGVNDYTGQTFVESGTVKITNLSGTGRNTATDSGKPVTISGGATLELAEASEGTYYKVLNGDGTLVKSSSMDITLDGRNSHRNTIIQNGRLDINNDQALGTHTTTMRSGTTLGFNGSMTMDGTNNFLLEGNATMDTKVNDVTIETTIGGRGKLTKIGSGVLTLENVDNSFQGGLDINGGKVLVYDQRALGPNSVLNNATLELNLNADATLRTDIFSDNGTFIKSGSKRLDVDHHFIANRFEMTGGTIAVRLDNESYIEAKNGFNISGSSKLIGKYVGSEGIRRGESNGTLFLALDGSGSDYFSKGSGNAGIENITADLDALKHISWRTVQQGNKLYYELWSEAYHEVYDLPFNADQAAQGADRLPEDSPLNVALSKLTSEDDLLTAFEQLHGEIKVSAMYAEADMQRGFNEFILRRSIPCEDCYQFKGFRGQNARSNSRELWATFTGGGDFRSSFDRFSGYKIGHWGVIAGLEQTFAPGFFAGAAVGYDKADMSLKDLPSKDEFYAFRVAAYMNYNYGNWSVNGFAGYSRNWHDMERRIDFLETTAKAKYEDDVTTFGVESRYLIHWNSLDFIPSIGLNYVHIDSPYIQEDGAGSASLHYKRHEYESLRLPIGFRANSRFDLQGIELKPELRMFYVPEMGDKRVIGTTAYSADPSNVFLVDTGVDSRNSFRIGVGTQAKVFERLNLGVDYDAEIWNKFSRHRVAGYLQVRY